MVVEIPIGASPFFILRKPKLIIIRNQAPAMSVEFENGRWIVERPKSELDGFVDEFVRLLEKQNIRYAIVSGYVSILFGRSRNSEDIDLFIEKLDSGKFKAFWTEATKTFECINTNNEEGAYKNYLGERIAIRFCKREEVIPNIELRFPKTELDQWTLDNASSGIFNGRLFKISPLELQIPYKLYLGSDKDFEDARHLWLVSKEHLNSGLLKEFIRRLGREKEAEKWLE